MAMLFGLILSRTEKINKKYNESLAMFLPQIKLNNNVSSVSEEDLYDLKNRAILQGISFKTYSLKLEYFYHQKMKLKKIENYFSKLVDEYNDQETISYILDKKSKITQKNLKYPILEYIKNIQEKIQLRNHCNKCIEQTNYEINEFNLVTKEISPSKVISHVNTSITFDDVENNKNIQEVFDVKDKVATYIDFYDFMSYLQRVGAFIPVSTINEDQRIKDYWKNIWSNITFEDWTDDINTKLTQEKDFLQKYVGKALTMQEWRESINDQLRELKQKVDVNSLLETWVRDEYLKLTDLYENIVSKYQNQSEIFDEIIEQISQLHQKILYVTEQYNKMIMPFDMAIKELHIYKAEQVSDIREYFLYSVIKLLEKHLGTYGTAKHIEESDVSTMIASVEKNCIN